MRWPNQMTMTMSNFKRSNQLRLAVCVRVHSALFFILCLLNLTLLSSLFWRNTERGKHSIHRWSQFLNGRRIAAGDLLL